MATFSASPKTPLHKLHLKPGPQPRSHGGCVLKIIRYNRMGSSNTKAKSLAEKQAAEWSVVVSEVQTHGSGRSGRTWNAPKGGLWSSLIITPRVPSVGIPAVQYLFANGLRKVTAAA